MEWIWPLVYFLVGGGLHFWPLRQIWDREHEGGFGFMSLCLLTWPAMLFGGMILMAIVLRAERHDTDDDWFDRR